MKKYLLLLGVSVLAFNAYAEEVVCGEDQVLSVGGTSCKNAKNNRCGNNCSFDIDKEGNVRIYPTDPNISTGDIGGWGVLMNNGPDFYDIRSVKIEEGITALGAGAFLGQSNIQTAILPSSLTNIEYGPMRNAKNLVAYCSDDLTNCNAVSNQYFTYKQDGENILVYNNDAEKTLKGVYESWEKAFADKIVDSYEKYDEATGMHKKYDGRGNFVNQYAQNADGSTYIYDEDGELITIRGKRIYTIEEAETVTKDGDKFRVFLKYK